jgi:hypothetical protein
MNKLRHNFAGGLTVLVLAACTNQQPPEQTNLPKEWATRLSPYGLVTVFPPRTNVEPGDVYIICAKPADDASQVDVPPQIFVTSLPGFHDAVETFFKSRWDFPSDPKVDGSSQVISVSSTSTGIKSQTEWKHLALASFPTVFQVTGTTTSGGASAPTGFAIFGLGGQRKSLQTYQLSMPAAEWAGLPWLDAQKAAARALSRRDVAWATDKKNIIQLYRQQVEDNRNASLEKYKNTDAAGKKSICNPVELAYVQEVYYARHMTLSFGTDKSSAISAQARLYVAQNQARYNVLQAASQPAVADAASAASSPDARVAQALKQLADAQAAANAANALSLPGASLTSAHVSDDGVAFDYYFAQPVAVGAKIIDIDIAKSSNGDEDLAANWKYAPKGRSVGTGVLDYHVSIGNLDAPTPASNGSAPQQPKTTK